ncbi:MAG: hypothetical protein M1819_002829 [Sarea resinae]|nr:MAG: hypothetical protein M1819_002829 [Sarea resinae]
MEDLLKPLKSSSTVTQGNGDIFEGRSAQPPEAAGPSSIPISTPHDALELLRSQPDHKTLLRIFKFIDPIQSEQTGFNINAPGPASSQLVNVLVTKIVPDYWSILATETLADDESSTYTEERSALLRCLKSVTGLGAITTQLNLIVVQSRGDNAESGLAKPDISQHITNFLSVMLALMEHDSFVWEIWTEMTKMTISATQETMLWKEFISLVASGKVLAIVAEAVDVVKSLSTSHTEDTWIGNGRDYASWIGQNIATMASKLQIGEIKTWKALAQFCAKSFSLGYLDPIVQQVYYGLLIRRSALWVQLRSMLAYLQEHEQKHFLYSMLRVVSRESLGPSQKSDTDLRNRDDERAVAGASALLAGTIFENRVLKNSLATWLTGNSGGGSSREGINVRRAAIAALSSDEDQLQMVLEQCMQTFGDKLYIKHTPIMHQEVNAQVLLLSAGYTHRSSPMFLFTLARSSIHLNSISNRLASSSPRARFLGMVVGVIISELIDKPDKRMAFGTEGMDSPEARWYKSLAHIHDEVGSLDDLVTRDIDLAGTPSKGVQPRSTERHPRKAPAKGHDDSLSTNNKANPAFSARRGGSKIISIKEVDDESGSEEDEEFVPYQKPDSDAEDEDDDPTLVQRNKPTAPVYIRDLLSGLRETENYDRLRMALTSAASLIRRKANFGSEVTEHSHELAIVLTGLHDKFEMENFHESRLQAMIALLVAQPLKMGQWFSKAFFEGDYSMGQRASILTTLGMGARELAGYKDEDGALTGANLIPEHPFPSKELPESLYSRFSADTSGIDVLAKKLQHAMIEPMAVEAVDNLSGPKALKVRTFSSRMEVERKRKKPISNELAKVVAEGFFFPLTGQWWVHIQAFGKKSVQFSPFLLSTYLKTLSLILNASGASTVALPQMTSELWDLLLSLRTESANDSSVLEALLFAILTLLDINDDKRRLVEEHSRELLETQGWAEMIFSRTAGVDEEGERVRMLVAGVLVRTREVVEKYQRLLMGDMVDY